MVSHLGGRLCLINTGKIMGKFLLDESIRAFLEWRSQSTWYKKLNSSPVLTLADNDFN